MKKGAKIYISGPMTGIKNENREEFDKYEKILKHLGYTPFNPAKFAECLHGWDLEECYEVDIDILKRCDAVCFMKNWALSNGAVKEHMAAVANGIEIITPDDLLKMLWEVV